MSRRHSKPKIDWDTVELVGDPVPIPLQKTSVETPPTITIKAKPDRPRSGRSVSMLILSGAAAKARARGAVFTHTQLRKALPDGFETFVYGLALLGAALESDRDISRAVELAAHALVEASRRLSEGDLLQ